ncbi:MAG TPA: hypothetical protein PKK96_10500 [Anaerolineales bacterium]|nr:hypothetical protein [Anaerolineales bacterium]HNQ95246.1 hypothetical protein [Anaerolineales bacterium]HNS61421.1 hypothetical protein [Anaerolineales bacterium]
MKPERKLPLIEIITLLGVILFVARSLYFAHSSLSIGDEGAYLFKGLVFARGEFAPFEDYGYWTNKAPLAFLIPGEVQYWFGAGLREARYFAIAVSFFMLAGVWILANRICGKNWAAVVMWVFALSDATVSFYSQALSQGLVACILTWVFVCALGALGEKRPLWQIVLASLLSVLIVMTRQNMVVFLPLLVLYIFWQHGKKAGVWSLASSASLFILFHIIYLPNIMQLWSLWLPESLTPFLNYSRPFAVFGYDTFNITNLSRIQSVAIGIQHHFFLLCGFAGALILFPSRAEWKSASQFRSAIFLGASFILLFLMHTWASLFNQFCIQCFSPYQMFYSIAGFLFIVIVFSNGVSDSKIRRAILFIVLLFFAAGLGSYYFQRTGEWSLAAIQFPRVNDAGQFTFASLGEILTYIFNLPLDIQKRIGAALTGMLVGLALLIFYWIAQRFTSIKNWTGQNASLATLNLFLLVGVILPPAANAGTYATPCSTNFLAYYEQAGHALADAIPPDSLIYWKGSGRHIAMLLYMDDVRYFPPQITAGAGYVRAGDPDRLLRFGLFSDEMDSQWRESADYFIIWKGYPNTNLDDFQNDPRYEPVPFDMENLAQCEDVLYLFRKRP